MLVDTGPIVAILNKSDLHHAACVEQLRQIRGPLLTCWPVLTEAVWLLRRQRTAVRTLLASFDGKPFSMLPLNQTDLSETAAILEKYENLGMQLADASLAYLANREGIELIFTLDRRNLSVMRLPRGKRFRVIP